MLTEALTLLQRRLETAKAEHHIKPRSLADRAQGQFSLHQGPTIRLALEAYVTGASAEIADFNARIASEVGSIVETLLLPLSEEAKQAVSELAIKHLEGSTALRHFDRLREAIEGNLAMFGKPIDLAKESRVSLLRSQLQVGEKNAILGSSSSIADDLELVRLHSLRESQDQQRSSAMPLTGLMNDKVDLLRANGEKVSGLKASVHRDSIYMAANGLVVKPGDLILRRPSTGAEETKEVIDPVFYEKVGGVAAHYQMHVKKLGVPEAQAAIQNITYNVSGPNARINTNSIDNSTNVVRIDARVTQHIRDLRAAIEQLPEGQRGDAEEIVNEVEDAFQTGTPKKSVVSALLRALPHAANIATIAAAIIALL